MRRIGPLILLLIGLTQNVALASPPICPSATKTTAAAAQKLLKQYDRAMFNDAPHHLTYIVAKEDKEPPEHELVLAIKSKTNWRLYRIGENAGPQGTFVDPTQDKIFIFGMWDSGDPGSNYDLFTYSPAEGPSCLKSIDFPDLKSNEYLKLRDFNLNKSGAGELLGSVLHENGSRTWYSYAVSEDGKRWKRPVAIQGPRRLNGRLVRLSMPDN